MECQIKSKLSHFSSSIVTNWAATAIMITDNPTPSRVVKPLSAADTPYIRPKGIAPNRTGTQAQNPAQNAAVDVQKGTILWVPH